MLYFIKIASARQFAYLDKTFDVHEDMSYTKAIINDMSDYFGEKHIHEPFVNRLE